MKINVVSIGLYDTDQIFSLKLDTYPQLDQVNFVHFEIPDFESLQTFDSYPNTYLKRFVRQPGPLLLIFSAHGIHHKSPKTTIGFTKKQSISNRKTTKKE